MEEKLNEIRANLEKKSREELIEILMGFYAEIYEKIQADKAELKKLEQLQAMQRSRDAFPPQSVPMYYPLDQRFF